MTDAAYTPSMDDILKGYVDGAGSGWLRDVRRENFTAALAAFEQSIRTQIAADIRADKHQFDVWFSGVTGQVKASAMTVEHAAALAERGQG